LYFFVKMALTGQMRKRWELTLHCPERVKSTKLRAQKEYNIT